MITNIPEFRCRKYPKGWSIEVQIEVKKLFRRKQVWVHAVSWAGMSDKPYYYNTQEAAIDDFLLMLKRELIYNS